MSENNVSGERRMEERALSASIYGSVAGDVDSNDIIRKSDSESVDKRVSDDMLDGNRFKRKQKLISGESEGLLADNATEECDQDTRRVSSVSESDESRYRRKRVCTRMSDSDDIGSVSNSVSLDCGSTESCCGDDSSISDSFFTRNVSDIDSNILSDSDSEVWSDSDSVRGFQYVSDLHSESEDDTVPASEPDDSLMRYDDILSSEIPGSSDHTCNCWIKKLTGYKDIQTKKIRAKHDAVELLGWINANSKTLTQKDNICYRRWWLTTATEYNHIELVNLILTDERHFKLYRDVNYNRFDLNRPENYCHFVRPLYIAIEKGHLSLVQRFLLAGASVTMTLDDETLYLFSELSRLCVWNISRFKDIHLDVSAVEYACIVNQPEALKLIASHFDQQHAQHMTHADKSSGAKSKAQKRITGPLHLITRLATKFYGQNLVQLPAYVQLIIEGGADVNCMDEYKFTPLQRLIRNIRILAPLEEVGIEHRRVIVDIARALLNAGSNPNALASKRDKDHPLMLLIRYLFPWKSIMIRTEHFSLACVIRNSLQLVNNLVRMLLLNGADVKRFSFYTRIPYAAAEMLKCPRLSLMSRADCTQVCDEIMNCFSNLFRLALLAGAMCRRIIIEQYFTSSFITIVDFSCRDGRSKKLINMLTSELPAGMLGIMSLLLKRNLRNRDPRRSSKKIYRAIEYVDNIDISRQPRRLEYMAARVIRQALPARILLGDTSKDLGLSPSMVSLIILLQ